MYRPNKIIRLPRLYALPALSTALQGRNKNRPTLEQQNAQRRGAERHIEVVVAKIDELGNRGDDRDE